jgi:hypothetical protein
MLWTKYKQVCTYHLFSLVDKGILQPWHSVYMARIRKEESNGYDDGTPVKCAYCYRDAEHEVYYYNKPY